MLEIIFPFVCLVCERPLRSGLLCRRCRLPKFPGIGACCPQCEMPSREAGLCPACCLHPLPMTRIFCCWDYAGVASTLIAIAKYRPSYRLTRIVCEYAAGEIARRGVEFHYDYVVPMPTSRRSLLERGFNQALVFAEYVSRATGVPLARNVLLHRGSKAPQASLRVAARVRNVRQAFRAEGDLSQKNMLLVDDVLTTGATSLAATLALRAAGAREVHLAVLARSPQWPRLRGLNYPVDLPTMWHEK